MAGPYLLDTNVLIAVSRGNEEIRGRLSGIPLNQLLLSAVVLGELEFGAEKSAYGDHSRARLAEVTELLVLVPLDREAARRYGPIRAQLERRGTPIGANDLWIAAQALALGATVVTDNEREFRRVPGLRVENWLAR